MTDKLYNILFVLTDQERYLCPEMHKAFLSALPGRNRLKKHGVTFTNHHINSAVCTSSRSVIYSGQHIQRTGMFDNLEYYWSTDFSTSIPTLGDMMSKAGYYSAYKGKWHLALALEEHTSYENLPTKHLTKVMEDYGFKDYVGVGDIIGTTWGGYLNDEAIGAQAQRWLRMTGKSLNLQGEQWFKAVNLVNPHDTMWLNTDPIAPTVQAPFSQSDPMPLSPIAPVPDSKWFKKKWTWIGRNGKVNGIPLPTNWEQPIEEQGRPATHKDWYLTKGVLNGLINPSYPKGYRGVTKKEWTQSIKERWVMAQNYYFNCIRKTDQVLEGILDELDDMGLMENTIIVMTSDHGEIGGAHGLCGKGNTAYKEQTHVPLIISHPGTDYVGTRGQECSAVTSHLDLAPTLVNMGCQASQGVNTKTHQDITQALRGYDLCGEDLTPLLEKGDKAAVDELHENGVLYCYNMYSVIDGEFSQLAQDHYNSHGGTYEGFEYAIDIKHKRGAIRSVFDGQYRYSRYYSPENQKKKYRQVESVKEMFPWNDIELFNLTDDPTEMHNLATGSWKDLKPEVRKKLDEMNQKMNALIEAEVGVDDGSYLPDLEGKPVPLPMKWGM